VLLESEGFAQAREAGEWVSRLKRDGAVALAQAPVRVADGVDERSLAQALQRLEPVDN
jgi:tryptophanyl-tRNA synthetase